MGTTTIQLNDATKEELEALKEGDKESYDEVVWRLIEHYTLEEKHDLDENTVREIVREEISERVVPKAQR